MPPLGNWMKPSDKSESGFELHLTNPNRSLREVSRPNVSHTLLRTDRKNQSCLTVNKASALSRGYAPSMAWAVHFQHHLHPTRLRTYVHQDQLRALHFAEEETQAPRDWVTDSLNITRLPSGARIQIQVHPASKHLFFQRMTLPASRILSLKSFAQAPNSLWSFPLLKLRRSQG